MLLVRQHPRILVIRIAIGTMSMRFKPAVFLSKWCVAQTPPCVVSVGKAGSTSAKSGIHEAMELIVHVVCQVG